MFVDNFQIFEGKKLKKNQEMKLLIIFGMKGDLGGSA